MNSSLETFITGLNLESEKESELKQLIALESLKQQGEAAQAKADLGAAKAAHAGEVASLQGRIAELEQQVANLTRDYSVFSPALEVVDLG